MKSIIVLVLVLAGCGATKEYNVDCASTSFQVCRDNIGKLWVDPNVEHLIPEADYLIKKQ